MTISATLKHYGPGIAVAATGVGAGDLVAASVGGAKFGTVILWAAVVGAVIKFALNEGLARWQLATGTTVLEGWLTRFHRFVGYYFIVYLVLWSFIVAAALISACGLAAHAMVPELSVATWGMLHSVAGVVLVYIGRYALFERMMKFFVALMFVTVIACAAMIRPDLGELLPSLFIPTIPEGSAKFIFGVIGGVGGSVTVMCYGYWIREKGWDGPEYHGRTKKDLGVAYALTGLFGAAMIIIAAGVNPNVMTGDTMALEVAQRIGDVVGLTGKWVFLVGFWGAVFSSLFGVWQGVPYLFADFVTTFQRRNNPSIHNSVTPNSWYYKGFLLFLAFPPMLLLLFGKPVWIIVIYAVTGAFFMPFLAGTLLWMNNTREWVGELRNRWLVNALLVLSLVLFGYLAATEIVEAVG
jgi:Mn2+/Fe2+ NRAMP family transporter